MPSTVRWEPHFPERKGASTTSEVLGAVRDSVDQRLIVAFEDLRCLALITNEKVQEQTPWEGQPFQSALNAIQSRLLQLPSRPEDTTAESLRLGMLAFLTTPFLLPSRQGLYTYSAIQFRELFRRVDQGQAAERSFTLRLWALMIGAISVLNADEDWVVKAWQMVVGERAIAWEEAKEQLRSVIWIDCIHDEPGEGAFRKLNTRAESRGSRT